MAQHKFQWILRISSSQKIQGMLAAEQRVAYGTHHQSQIAILGYCNPAAHYLNRIISVGRDICSGQYGQRHLCTYGIDTVYLHIDNTSGSFLLDRGIVD